MKEDTKQFEGFHRVSLDDLIEVIHDCALDFVSFLSVQCWPHRSDVPEDIRPALSIVDVTFQNQIVFVRLGIDDFTDTPELCLTSETQQTFEIERLETSSLNDIEQGLFSFVFALVGAVARGQDRFAKIFEHLNETRRKHCALCNELIVFDRNDAIDLILIIRK